MDKKLQQKFIEIVGADAGIVNKTEQMAYTYDASYFLNYRSQIPGIVLCPQTTEQVAAILSLANEEKISVIPRGAGTNVCGSALPMEGCVILDLTKMNKILEVDVENMVAVVEPGVITEDLQSEVARYGLFYPPDPASKGYSTIGGNLALGAGGPHGLKYGVTKDYALSLEVVLASGQVIKTGRRTIKNVAGYDLTKLFVGSEGTLGVITKATLRLITKPASRRTIMVAFSKLEDAAGAVTDILLAGVTPATLELIDQVYIKNIEEYAQIGLPVEAEAILLIDVDGDKASIDSQSSVVEQVCLKIGAKEVVVATTEEKAEELWKARRAAFPAMGRLRPTVIGEDVTVPRTKIPQMVTATREISREFNVLIGVVGHAGDGNLHATFLCDDKDQEEMKRVKEAIEKLCNTAVKLGGTITGEHGVGRAKTKYLKQQLDEDTWSTMLAIKKALDPNGILNPEVIFSD